MPDKKMEYRWGATASKPKDLTVSEMIHEKEANTPYNPGDLRDYLVQRTMARHGFIEEQALAEILAFGNQGVLKSAMPNVIP